MTTDEFINRHQFLWRTVGNVRQLLIFDKQNPTSMQSYGLDFGETSLEEFEFFSARNLDEEIFKIHLDEIMKDFDLLD